MANVVLGISLMLTATTLMNIGQVVQEKSSGPIAAVRGTIRNTKR